MAEQLRFLFSPSFLEDHAGQIIRDPRVAVVELVANSWDAGATKVQVQWPSDDVATLLVVDDGHGMTAEEFRRRWCTLSYQRLMEQGPFALSADGRPTSRRAFGKNGKGRHAAFCFGAEYTVCTWRDGQATTARIRRSASEESPFEMSVTVGDHPDGHGTSVMVPNAYISGLTPEDVRETLGARFLLDPGFSILVNGVPVSFTDIGHMLQTRDLDVDGLGVFRIHLLDVKDGDRTMRHHGVAYWVNRRLVGAWSWDALNRDGRLLDGRSSEAKRFTFIVEADPLESEVLADWTGFRDTLKVSNAVVAVEGYISAQLRELLQDSRQQKRQRILSTAANTLRQVPSTSRHFVGKLVEEMVERCPAMREQDMTNMVEIAASLEKARTGYSLLEQLATVRPEDLDHLSEILTKWTISDAKRVLDQLHWRLELISRMEALVKDPAADELHELQPLFERGLWIFGPEYESVHFTSNRSITQVVRELFDSAAPAQSPKRPDFVILPDASASIGVYGCPRFAEGSGEEVGPDRLVIVELKRGGVPIGEEQMNQARKYSRLLRQSGKLLRDTRIQAFVLGSKVDDFIEPSKEGEFTEILPMAYDWLLGRAHSRTFRLLKDLESFVPDSDELNVQATLEVDRLPAV